MLRQSLSEESFICCAVVTVAETDSEVAITLLRKVEARASVIG
jgi:hypothetical protein